MSKAVEIEGYMLRVHTRYYDRVNGVVVCHKGENDKMFFPLKAIPHGEWIVQRLQNGFDDVYCPFCKARPTRSEYGYYLRDNFCHECGADMRLRILDEADDGAGKDGNVKEGDKE